MRRSGGIAQAVSVVGLAFAGLVGGHAIGYAVAVPDPHHRAAVISEAGHGYLPSASWVGIVLGLAALVAGVAAGYARRGQVAHGGPGRMMSRLIPLQAGAFVLLEVFERLASGASLGSFSPRLVFVGVLTQVIIGALIALLLAGLRRVGLALSAESCAVVLAPVVGRVAPPDEDVARCRYGAITRVRAPPLAHAA